MKTGDTVRDDQGRVFQIGQILGRGLWGKTYSVREEHGPEWALRPVGAEVGSEPNSDITCFSLGRAC